VLVKLLAEDSNKAECLFRIHVTALVLEGMARKDRIAEISIIILLVQ